MRAEVLGQLYSIATDAARGIVHKCALPRQDLAFGREMQRGQSGDRDRRGLLVVHFPRYPH